MADAPLGTFEEQILVAVLRVARAGDAIGMAVRRELEEVTGREVSIGAVYATLDRLEAKALVRSERGEASRRVFKITQDGARALHHSRQMRDRLWEGVELAGHLGRAAKAR